MLTWKAEGLPSDDLSVENAIVLLHTQQVPLVIDPSAQAAEWLKKHLRDRVASMEVVRSAGETSATAFCYLKDVRFCPAMHNPLLLQGKILLVKGPVCSSEGTAEEAHGR